MSNIIQEQIDYIKNKEIYVRKDYLIRLESLIQTLNIVVIEWQRRVWKSSILISYIKANNISLDKIFYFNKELDVLDNIKNAWDLEILFEEFKKLYQDPEYIFIDEIQDIENWEKFIRKYNSYKKYKIIITWSNSKLLSWELSSYLTWRYLSMLVLSFNYKEFLDFKWFKKSKETFFQYLEFWWMPEILFIENYETKKNYIKNVISNIVLKDIVLRYNIRDIKLIEKLLNFLSDNVWSLVSITNISWYLKNQFKQEYSTKTIANYLKYLEFPYIINEVSRYDIKWKKILEYVWKYYFSDVWIKNSYSFIFAKDIWKILENLVYLKLLWEWYKIFVWENNWNEVDFVAEKNWEKIYIQVCYLLSWENVIKREFWNLLKIKDNYRKIVISMDESFWNTYDGVENINIIDFLA